MATDTLGEHLYARNQAKNGQNMNDSLNLRHDKIPTEQRPAIVTYNVAENCQTYKQTFTLMKLPREILRLILLFALPDPTDFLWAGNPRGTVILFLQPLLQASCELRHLCLDLISREHIWIWIEVQSSHNHRTPTFLYELRRLPSLPVEFRYLLSPDASRVILSLKDHIIERELPAVHGSNEAALIVLPYNFFTLTALIHLASSRSFSELVVDFWNVTPKTRKEYLKFVVPALSNIHNVERVHWQWEGRDVNTPKHIPKPFSNSIRDFNGVMDRAINLLQLADILEADDHSDEATVLLLSSGWILLYSRDVLPRTWAWPQEESSPEPQSYWTHVKVEHHSRHPNGNQFRSLLHRIEHRACLGCIQLLKRYGNRWVSKNDQFFYRSTGRFCRNSNFNWFGLTAAELAEYHCNRALWVYENALSCIRKWKEMEKERKEKEGKIQSEEEEIQSPSFMTPREKITREDSLALATIQMSFAHRLQPWNRQFHKLYEEFRNGLAKRWVARVASTVQARLIIIDGLPGVTSTTANNVCWVGDREMLRGDMDTLLQNFHLTQRGLDDPESFQRLVRYYRENGLPS